MSKQSGSKSGTYVMPLSIAVGLIFGSGIGAAIQNVGAGIGVGLAFGAAVGLLLTMLSKRKAGTKKSKQDRQEPGDA